MFLTLAGWRAGGEGVVLLLLLLPLARVLHTSRTRSVSILDSGSSLPVFHAGTMAEPASVACEGWSAWSAVLD